ncbi:hypothetical protein OUZ56_023737 [Daphnia magna]|uniref:Uncharacterized protein n=1 Tax=Daphnia magna TaxID=35525 RepID=A0ABR0AZD9_9CRUS|nr:hypothetical protein OUZ56_023737 [Daphnia magna]
MAQNPTPPTKRQRHPELRVTPVIIKFNDGGHTFKNISIMEREYLRQTIFEAAGNPRDALVLRGGDLSVTPYDRAQQTRLLNLQTLSGRPVICSLPNSSLMNRNGVIFGVPVGDKEEEILEALKEQGVIKMAYLEGIPIEEARARQVNRTYGPARKPMAASPTQDSLNSSQYLEMAAVKEQLKALQEEIKVMREKTFPRINGKINDLVEDLAATNEKIANFDTRFDNVKKQQVEMTNKLTAGFDKLEGILTSLITSSGPQINTQYRPPHHSHQFGTANALGIGGSRWLPHRSTSPIFNFNEDNMELNSPHDD